MSKHTLRSTLASLTLVVGFSGITACIPGIQFGAASSSNITPASGVAPAPNPTAAPSSPSPPPSSSSEIQQPPPTYTADDVRELRAGFEKAASLFGTMRVIEERLDQATWDGNGLAETGANCTAAVERAMAKGVPKSTELVDYGAVTVKTTLGDMQATLCDVLVASSKTWKARIAAAQRGTADRVAAPYKALGISGDKLAFLVEYIDVALWGIGGNELTTPQEAKQASVIFLRIEGATEWTLRRYKWNGNKLAGTTEESFLTKPGSSKYR